VAPTAAACPCSRRACSGRAGCATSRPAPQSANRPPAIGRHLKALIEVIGELVVERIDGEMIVIKGAAEIAVQVLPCFPAVLRTINPGAELGHIAIVGVV